MKQPKSTRLKPSQTVDSGEYASSQPVGQLSADHACSSSAFGLFTGNDFSGVHPENGDLDPTVECMLSWVAVYKIMNRCLFGGKLPNCMITLERRGRAFGYFRPSSFKNREDTIAHQIAMNPEFFEPYGDLEAFQTFAHEMCHLWREVLGPRNCNGSNGTRGYHCRAWGRKMEEIGLMPSHTGKPKGRKTGYQMAEYVIEGGKFDLLSKELLQNGMHVDWRDASSRVAAPQASEEIPELEGMLLMPEGEVSQPSQKPSKKPQKRIKFECPSCRLKAYAKRSARLRCDDCDLPMVAQVGGPA